jgi:GDPmannose 4,6-dehydratase
VDPCYFRPTEVETISGYPSEAKEKPDWGPKMTSEEIMHKIMENDINIAKHDSLVKEYRFKAPDSNE